MLLLSPAVELERHKRLVTSAPMSIMKLQSVIRWRKHKLLVLQISYQTEVVRIIRRAEGDSRCQMCCASGSAVGQTHPNINSHTDSVSLLLITESN